MTIDLCNLTYLILSILKKMLFGKELAEGADGAEKRHPQEKAPPSGAPHERGH